MSELDLVRKVTICWEGRSVGSSHPERREIYFNSSHYWGETVSVLEDVKAFIRVMLPTQLPSFDEYVKYCKYCKPDVKCLRHRTVDFDLPNVLTIYSNRLHELVILSCISIDKIELNKEGWKVEIDREKIVVTRPSGVKFTYVRRNPVSSYHYILQLFSKLVDDIYTAIKLCPPVKWSDELKANISFTYQKIQ
jgi:hypothetical protein